MLFKTRLLVVTLVLPFALCENADNVKLGKQSALAPNEECAADATITAETASSDPACSVNLTIPTYARVVQKSTGLYSVTSLGDHVYIAGFNYKYIDDYIVTYDNITFERSLYVPELGELPYGLAVMDGFIFVSDFGNHRVHRVELTGNNSVTSWPVTTCVNPCGLSWTNEHNLLIACFGGFWLQEYTTDGILVRSIATPLPFFAPKDAVQLSNGDFVVTVSVGLQADVIRMDENRTLHAVYSDSESVGTLYNLNGIYRTSQDSVLVVDRGSDRIIHMDSSLSDAYVLQLEVEDGHMNSPHDVFLDELRCLLHVVDYYGQSLLVFNVGQ